ncbi:MAG: SHOCT domain-containing protein [Euryarchaeota archaeon]|nr:SHOCT domain-containing protein [Euryarchaeota archaeon]
MGGAGAYPGYSPGWFQLVLLLLAAGVLLAYYARSGERASSGARDILDMRLARGEITLEEYRKLREVIEE